MKRLTHMRVNGLQRDHWSPARNDELVERLAQYEDLGYDPEELKMILDMIIPDLILESARRIKAEEEKKDERT